MPHTVSCNRSQKWFESPHDVWIGIHNHEAFQSCGTDRAKSKQIMEEVVAFRERISNDNYVFCLGKMTSRSRPNLLDPGIMLGLVPCGRDDQGFNPNAAGTAERKTCTEW